ncbi:MAG: cupredoxin domain-containing protein [Candidatus Limnocylindrales bacterium]
MIRLTTPGGRRRAGTRTIRLGSTIAAVAMLAAALSTQSAIAASPEPGVEAVRVAVEDFAFTPASVTIDAGASVVWAVRKDPEQHTVTPLDPDAFAASGQLFDGDDYTVRFERTGRYDYACSLHPFMIGTVIVQAPVATPAVTPTSSTPASPVSSASSAAQVFASDAAPSGSARPGAVSPDRASDMVAPIAALAALAVLSIALVALTRRRRSNGTSPER